MLVRTIHRSSGLLLLLFLAAHIGNHLIALGGVAAHVAAMEALRSIYRQPVVEVLLLAAFAVQIITGLSRVIFGWKARSGRVAWLQAASGCYLALFLLIHVGAVLAARSDGVDTNFYFAAAGMHAGTFIWFFLPYYGLAVASLFAHLGCAIYWPQLARDAPTTAKRSLRTMVTVGMVTAATATALLAGWIIPVTIPPSYLAAFPS